MEKEFVTYGQALALKELGFDDTLWFGNQASLYDVKGEHTMYTNYGVMYSGLSDGYIPAPLKQQVFRWFRENHGWIGGIRQLSQSGNGMIIGEFRKDEDNSFMMFAETYEQCENYCIENLIKMVKPQDNG